MMNSKQRWTLYTCSGVCALIMLDTNVVAVSLPSIARSLNASFVDVEWVVSAYMLAFASFLLPAGSIADQLGRKRVMLAGLGVFALASLFCGLAWTTLVLNLARAVKGIGAALLLTSALAVIGNTFHDEKERLHAWSVWGACMGAAMTVAPLLGGLITSAINWRWIFYLNLPVVAVLIHLVRRHVTESKDDNGASFDPLGAGLFSGGLFCIIWGLIDGSVAGWHSATTMLRFGAGALLLCIFIVAELMQRAAMIDLHLFRHPRFVGAVIGMFGYAISAQVLMTFLPLYLQNAFLYSAVAAGCAMLPFALAMVVFSRLSPFAGRWLGDRGMLTLGLLIVAAGNVATGLAATLLSYWMVAVGMTVTGAGAGLLNGTTQKAILGCIPPERSGMGSGISTTTRFVGIVLAVGGLGGVLATHTSQAFERLVAGQGIVSSSELIGRIVAGNAAQAFDYLPVALQPVARAAAKSAFIDGFASVLYLAGVLALCAAVLVFALAGQKTAHGNPGAAVAK
ncbi:MFS transporter [Janthinobacterium agaricidamnosum]|uniref:Major Facilitator Superfamily protein n=1 Tax=Janthinobacterium agaricidamnosum NBRC 102515 = DSM 9628 TaxID=1349767 RepID=W0V315_9BURK|nr:MFS transporter [Janthinobacterium agaricidamnosum]CDG83229.1 major Facilitator Superfamily protein [Janthinobacterium agaricidamnosum NBRC 102515 = DSM 9628]